MSRLIDNSIYPSKTCKKYMSICYRFTYCRCVWGGPIGVYAALLIDIKSASTLFATQSNTEMLLNMKTIQRIKLHEGK